MFERQPSPAQEDLTRIDNIAAPAEILTRLNLCRVLVRTGKRLQLIRSTRRHNHSLVIALFPKKTEQEKAREEPAWSAEAMNACWTTEWKRLELTGGIEEALEENTAQFDHFVDTEKMADALNDLFIKTVTNAARDLLATRPKDEEEWVRSRAQVTKLSKQRRDEREEAHRKRGVTAKAVEPRGKAEDKRQTHGKIRRLSVSQCVAKKRHENDRQRILGEQLDEALKKGEA